jgi:peptide/nickel transport system ATP-binding protein/oligopeptide transport system ATP-binding protein
MTENILLKVEDLRVYFRRPDDRTAKAVDGVGFDVRREETVCLVGESGCGKTVTALSILGLIPRPPGEIVAGRARFGELDLLTLDEEALQAIRGKRIAMVFQEPLTSLNPVFKIGDQIAEAIRVHENIAVDALHQICIQLLTDVGIPSAEDRFNAYPHELSGGQRQRVMIAMALACNPQLVIADEPTTALDVTVQAQILKLFRKLQQQRAMSLLYITHDLGVVANVADRVYVMYAGVVVEQGNTEHIFHKTAHPYTRGLLAALPSRRKRAKRLYSIPGTVPNPAFKPPGCPFHPRCPHVVDACREQFPDMCDYGEGHRSRCPVLYEKEKE